MSQIEYLREETLIGDDEKLKEPKNLKTPLEQNLWRELSNQRNLNYRLQERVSELEKYPPSAAADVGKDLIKEKDEEI